MVSKTHGFSLMEILISLAILVVGMTGIYSVYLSATQQHARAVDNTNVAIAAEGLMASVQAEVARNPRFNLKKAVTGVVPGMESYAYRIEFQSLDPEGLRVLCELSLTWKRRGRPVEHIFRTIALREELAKGH